MSQALSHTQNVSVRLAVFLIFPYVVPLLASFYFSVHVTPESLAVRVVVSCVRSDKPQRCPPSRTDPSAILTVGLMMPILFGVRSRI
jgi:hypothetical protein